ncbi:xylulokinase [uncultured Ruminococcus sp.]|uniref:xylulokinase n=1 Tax=uncultured Ruminococcus sp. TaxID=165186 RepID=UPI0025CC3FFC|nr:xylulokinase [uncultured Ruminococcus sp.]
MAYVIGVDCGTSGTKTVLFQEDGTVMASATVEYPMYQPKNGYAEQDPADWKNAMIQTIQTVVRKIGVPKEEIKGIGISGQMHGLVMLDQDNQVLRNSIIWCDQRTAAEVDEMNRVVGREKLMEITANPALTGWTAAKILWVRNNEPDVYEKCRHILLPKDYLRLILTGEYATEVSDASGMQLLDIANRCWSDELLHLLQIDKSLLGKVYESCEVTGTLTREMADTLGLCEGIVVVGGAGDNAAAAVGTGVVQDGKAFTTIGTSGVVFAHTSSMAMDKLGRVHTCCAAVPNSWHVMGVTQGAGLSLKWFRDQFCAAEKQTASLMGVDEYYLMDKEAEQVPVGANRLLYLPYLMGERTPHLDPNARGVFFGLSAMHTKRDMLRAVMEGVTYSLRDCVEVFREMGISVDDMMACGGGGTSPLWRSMLADLYNCPVKTVASKEGPSLGVAILASVGAGIYSSVPEACSAIVKTDKTQTPQAENVPAYESYYQLYRQIYPALKTQFATLAGLQ